MSDVRAISPWLDFGSVKFVLGSDTVEFTEDLNRGKMKLQHRRYRNETAITEDIIQRHKGWRARISTRLRNFRDTDKTLVEALIVMINDSCSTNVPITIYPRYNSTSAYQFSVACWFDGDFELLDVDEICSGQEKELDWIAKSLIVDIPAIFEQTTADTLISEDGNDLVTEDDKKIEREM